ncbi:hypothetical protein FKP32DRAFT_1456510 [Trametes sanguinea]|nr:hypothetical protein FKP32DRAFT_1456510 [Trametes sanguinea]
MHLRRYLLTLTAWHAAGIALIVPKIAIKQLNVYMLKSSPTLPLTSEDVSSTFDRYAALLTERLPERSIVSRTAIRRLEAIKAKFFTRNVNAALQAPSPAADSPLPILPIAAIHAEAVIMVLAWLHSQGKASSVIGDVQVELDDLFPMDGTVRFGASSRCCWACYFFGTALCNPQPPQQLSFILPGAHSIILPWVPPPHTPEEVLIKMRSKLFSIMHDQVCAHTPTEPLSTSWWQAREIALEEGLEIPDNSH